jgi:hypothetical protein
MQNRDEAPGNSSKRVWFPLAASPDELRSVALPAAGPTLGFSPGSVDLDGWVSV